MRKNQLALECLYGNIKFRKQLSCTVRNSVPAHTKSQKNIEEHLVTSVVRQRTLSQWKIKSYRITSIILIEKYRIISLSIGRKTKFLSGKIQENKHNFFRNAVEIVEKRSVQIYPTSVKPSRVKSGFLVAWTQTRQEPAMLREQAPLPSLVLVWGISLSETLHSTPFALNFRHV